MKHYRPRKYRGPGVWALVRDAYLAGEPAPIVAQRFDVGLANMRKKARVEGWTRAAHARATDRRGTGERPEPVPSAAPEPPPAPAIPPTIGLSDALRAAMAHAMADLAAGRGAKALTDLRAAEALARVAETFEAEVPLTEAEEAERRAAEQAEEAAQRRAFRDEVQRRAEQLAAGMFADEPSVPAIFGPWLWRWRAATFGPEAARRDFERAVSCGWATGNWDAEGRLRPPAPTYADPMMRAQHERACRWRTEHGREEQEEDLR